MSLENIYLGRTVQGLDFYIEQLCRIESYYYSYDDPHWLDSIIKDLGFELDFFNQLYYIEQVRFPKLSREKYLLVHILFFLDKAKKIISNEFFEVNMEVQEGCGCNA